MATTPSRTSRWCSTWPPGRKGFWWFQNGRLDDDRLSQDLRERLPLFYSEHGYIDFQVAHDSLAVDSTTGKASLDLNVVEGQIYRVGNLRRWWENRRFSTEEISHPVPPSGIRCWPIRWAREHPVFNRTEWDKATESIKTLYNNNGYIYVQVAAAGNQAGPPSMAEISSTCAGIFQEGTAGHHQQDRDPGQ